MLQSLTRAQRTRDGGFLTLSVVCPGVLSSHLAARWQVSTYQLGACERRIR